MPPPYIRENGKIKCTYNFDQQDTLVIVGMCVVVLVDFRTGAKHRLKSYNIDVFIDVNDIETAVKDTS